MSLTVGSLFSGIGGIELGLERSGFMVRWQVELDSYCRAILAKHWPDVPRYEDIRAIDWSEVEPVDMVCGGFPCQPVSLAGRRRGMSDERWLWPEFARCIREVRPRLVLLENVPGLFTSGFGAVLGDLAEGGYDAEWVVLSAQAVGAPHIRKRVFLVAWNPARADGPNTASYSEFIGRKSRGRCKNASGIGRPESRIRRHSALLDISGHEGTTPAEEVASKYWPCAQPRVCRSHDGIPSGLDGAVGGGVGEHPGPPAAWAEAYPILEAEIWCWGIPPLAPECPPGNPG